MAGRCKICASPNRERVEARLLTGESIHSLSAWLKTQGETISAPSIQRHKQNHFAATKRDDGKPQPIPLKNDKIPTNDEYAPFIDVENVLSKIQNDLDTQDVFASVIAERKFTQLLIEKIAQKQLVIVHELQDQYVAGKGGYPDTQIRGLKTILDMANSLPTYKNEKLLDDLKVDNVETVEQKILEQLQANIKTENLRYHAWYVVKEKPDPIPKSYIETSAVKLFQNEHQRDKWIGAMIEKCGIEFNKNAPSDWHCETMINTAFDIVAKEYGVDRKTIERRGLKALIDKFKTPRKAISDMRIVEQTIRGSIE